MGRPPPLLWLLMGSGDYGLQVDGGGIPPRSAGKRLDEDTVGVRRANDGFLY
jgi:hypothetical protein